MLTASRYFTMRHPSRLANRSSSSLIDAGSPIRTSSPRKATYYSSQNYLNFVIRWVFKPSDHQNNYLQYNKFMNFIDRNPNLFLGFTINSTQPFTIVFA